MFNGGKFCHNYCTNTNYKFVLFLKFSQNTKKEKKKYYKKTSRKKNHEFFFKYKMIMNPTPSVTLKRTTPEG